MAVIHQDDCERTATVALPTAASAGFISGELGTSVAFSTVYELPLTRCENRQNKLDVVFAEHRSRVDNAYYSSRSHGTVCTVMCIQQRGQLL